MDRAVFFVLTPAMRRYLRKWAHRRCARLLRAVGEDRAAELLEITADGDEPARAPFDAGRTMVGMPRTRPPAKTDFDRHLDQLPKLHGRE